MTVNGFAAYLQNTSGSGLTVRTYLPTVEEFERFLSGRQASVDTVESWAASLGVAGIRPQTIHKKLAAVRRYLGYLGRHGDAVALQTAAILREYRVAPPVRERDRKPLRIPTGGNVEALLRAAGNPRDRALVAILWGTGARVSEILGNHGSEIAPLTGAEGRRLAAGEVVRRSGKGGRVRRLVLAPQLRLAVWAWADQVPESAPLFPLSLMTAHRVLRRLSERAGVPPANPHAFRHAYKSGLEARGVPREVLMALLGHGAANVTDLYGMVSDDRLLAAIASH